MTKRFWVYILECSDRSYYTGMTSNVEKRLTEHQYHRYDGYTSRRLPVKLVFAEEFQDVQLAQQFERQIKGWTRRKKEALIQGNFEVLHDLARCTNSTSHILRGMEEPKRN